MHYLIICRDKPGMEETRAATRPSHLEYLGSGNYPVNRVLGNPLSDENAQRMIGTFFIVEAKSRADVDAFTGGDPYSAAGIFESVEVIPLHANFDPAKINLKK